MFCSNQLMLVSNRSITSRRLWLCPHHVRWPKMPYMLYHIFGGGVGFNWIIQSDHFAIIGAFVMSNRGDNNNRITNSLSVQLHLSISFELYWKPCCNDWMSCSGQQRQLLATLIHCHRECFPKKVQILPFVVRQRSLH